MADKTKCHGLIDFLQPRPYTPRTFAGRITSIDKTNDQSLLFYIQN